jgi:phage nucleotide-binding protein
LNALIYGTVGSGKTTLCASAQDTPTGADVLFIDVEGGTRSIADRPKVTVFRAVSWKDIQDAFAYLDAEHDKHPFKTVVIDSLTQVQKLSLANLVVPGAIPSLQEYGKSNDQVVRMVQMFKGLSDEYGWNIFFTALDLTEKSDETGSVVTRPNLTPGASSGVCQVVDTLGYLAVDPKTQKRTLLLEPRGTVLAKHRQPVSGNRLPGTIPDPSMAAIIEHQLSSTKAMVK